jgi:tight adherence protein C
MINLILDRDFQINLLMAIGVVATIITIGMPYLSDDNLGDRMKSVAIERTRLREKERLRMASGKGSLRQAPKAWANDVVDKFNLTKFFGQDEVKDRLLQAGMRGDGVFTTFLVVRFALPTAFFLMGAFYFFVVFETDYPFLVRAVFVGAFTIFGFYLPMIFIKNKIDKRYADIRKGFPDALDLLLICIESGMTIEVAMKKVAQEIGMRSIPLAEEFSLTTAELSFLPDRRMAYDNLAKRVELDGVKAVVMALAQAEKYGTPLGQAMRVMAQENRDIRMAEAERKAAGIPPKLTVPMIVCFLPVIFIVILGPPLITTMEWK